MEKTPHTIGVAVVGLGVGEQHARTYARLASCKLRWLYDLDFRKSQALVHELGADASAEQFEQILDDPETHIVSIASYDAAHFEQVVAALEAGKHVFVEKPLCRTVEELQTIKTVWSKRKGRLKLSSNLVLRAAPLYKWVKNQLESGGFGEVYAFDGDYLYGRLDKITHGWRTDESDYSVILGGGVHLIDLMAWLTGNRPDSVYAVGSRICTRHTDFHYPDFVSATLTFPSGLVGRITSNYGCVHQHHHIMRIFGTNATFIYDDAGPRLHTTRDPAVAAGAVDLPPLPAGKGDLIPDFVSAVRYDEDLDTQGMFDVISICAACDASLQSNSETGVQYV